MNYLVIDLRSPVPAYVQIQEQIRARVRERSLGPGAALPSIRQLAADLDVNPNTVAKAYMLLERDGILQTLPRRGVVIAGQAAEHARRAAEDRLEAALDEFLERAEGLGLEGKHLLEAMKQRIKQRSTGRARGRKAP